MKDIYVKDGNLFITPNVNETEIDFITQVKTLIKKTEPEVIKLDLTGMNMFSAIKIASTTAAMGLTQNIKNKYEIIVDDEITHKYIKLLGLSNISIKIQNKTNKKVCKNSKLIAIKI